MKYRIGALAFLLAVFASGCDLFGGEPDGTIDLTGRVVLAGTGEPIAGLGVTLRDAGSFGLYPLRATARTQADGTFSLSYDAGEDRSLHVVTVNDEPYNADYGERTASIRPGQQLDLGVIELEGLATP